GSRPLESGYCLIEPRLRVLALRLGDGMVLLRAGPRRFGRPDTCVRLFGICFGGLKALARPPAILHEMGAAWGGQRRSVAVSLGAFEIGACLVDGSILQDQALVDRGDRSSRRHDRRLVLRDRGPVVAIVNREEGLAGLDEVAGNNSDAGDDTAALGGKSNHLARGLNASSPDDAIPVRP